MISYSCSSVELSNRLFYPTFARTQPFSRTYSRETPDILLQSMRVYNWARAAIISTEDLVWTPIAISMTELFQKNNISVPFKGFYVPSSSFSHHAFLSEVKDKARIIFLLAFNDEVAKLLVAANELEMMNGEYAFITLDFTVESNWVNESWAGGRSMEDFVALFDGTVNLSVKGPHGEHYETFVRKFSETIKANNISETSITFQFAAYLHDAIQLYAVGLNRSVSQGGTKTDGTSIITNISNGEVLFKGMSGDVAINSEGNRIPVFVFSNRQNGSLIPIAAIDQTKANIESVTIYNMTTVWPNGVTTVPRDAPKCGFRGEKCSPEEKDDEEEEGFNYLWLLTLILMILVIGLLLGFLYYKRKVYENDLMNTSWVIHFKDIILCTRLSLAWALIVLGTEGGWELA